mmetsp:Transcript_29966/g.72967  ORF Transcript_29966/g.72967 Transcript_29966/m.72967 type:complete len:224 (-) Transcript_29966:459-1130(-)
MRCRPPSKYGSAELSFMQFCTSCSTCPSLLLFCWRRSTSDLQSSCARCAKKWRSCASANSGVTRAVAKSRAESSDGTLWFIDVICTRFERSVPSVPSALLLPFLALSSKPVHCGCTKSRKRTTRFVGTKSYSTAGNVCTMLPRLPRTLRLKMRWPNDSDGGRGRIENVCERSWNVRPYWFVLSASDSGLPDTEMYGSCMITASASSFEFCCASTKPARSGQPS